MKKYTSLDNHANQLNSNRGTSGFNKQYKAVQTNRSVQKNPTSKLYREVNNLRNNFPRAWRSGIFLHLKKEFVNFVPKTTLFSVILKEFPIFSNLAQSRPHLVLFFN